MLKYVPVMARPLVLGRTDHPTIWTPVYADIDDPKMTDWLWEQREKDEQEERFLIQYRRKLNMAEQDRRFVKQKKGHDQSSDLREYKLMTSVSMPVFDRRENAVRSFLISSRIQHRANTASRIDRRLHTSTCAFSLAENRKTFQDLSLGSQQLSVTDYYRLYPLCFSL